MEAVIVCLGAELSERLCCSELPVNLSMGHFSDVFEILSVHRQFILNAIWIDGHGSCHLCGRYLEVSTPLSALWLVPDEVLPWVPIGTVSLILRGTWSEAKVLLLLRLQRIRYLTTGIVKISMVRRKVEATARCLAHLNPSKKCQAFRSFQGNTFNKEPDSCACSCS